MLLMDQSGLLLSSNLQRMMPVKCFLDMIICVNDSLLLFSAEFQSDCLPRVVTWYIRTAQVIAGYKGCCCSLDA